MNLDKKIPTRNGFGDEIVALGKENKNILVVDADIGKTRCLSTPVASVSAQHPLWLVAKRLCRAPNISAGEQPRFNLLLHSGCRIC